MSADIIDLGARKAPSPRKEFGQRRKGWFQDPAVRAALGIASEGDRKIEWAARKAADEMAGGKAKRAQVDPDLHLALAARIEGLAHQARSLASEAKAYGHLIHHNTLTDLGDIAEKISAEIEAEVRR